MTESSNYETSMPRPETETHELRTDSWDEIIAVLEDGRLGHSDVPQARRTAIAERLREQRPTQDAIALCGLPGAGKSYVADKLSEIYGVSVVTMGDAIREEYANSHGVEPKYGFDSDELGEFAAKWRTNDPKGIPEKVAEVAARHNTELVITDGVRSVADHEVLTGYFENLYLIEVKAPFYKRLSRLQERGREGEDEWGIIDLAERDEREYNDLGFLQLKRENLKDVTLTNDQGESLLRRRLETITEENLPFEVENWGPVLPPVGASSDTASAD